MTGYEIRANVAAYRSAKRRAAQRAIALIFVTFSPWVAIALAARYLW